MISTSEGRGSHGDRDRLRCCPTRCLCRYRHSGDKREVTRRVCCSLAQVVTTDDTANTRTSPPRLQLSTHIDTLVHPHTLLLALALSHGHGRNDIPYDKNGIDPNMQFYLDSGINSVYPSEMQHCVLLLASRLPAFADRV